MKCMVVSFSDNPLFNPLLAQVPVSGGGGSHAGAASRKLLSYRRKLSQWYITRCGSMDLCIYKVHGGSVCVCVCVCVRERERECEYLCAMG